MAFNNSDENDLVYPNLVNCQITVSNALVLANNDSLPAPPPPFSSANAQSLVAKPPVEKYDFKIEDQVLVRNKTRGENSGTSRSLESNNEFEHGSVEVTLSDLKDSLK